MSMSLPLRIAAALLFPVPIVFLFATSKAPPAGKTGAPGDGNCAECHAGTADLPGRVLIDFTKLAYTPGQKQTIGVHVLPSRTPTYTGFQLTARLASNEQVQAGHFEGTDVVGVQMKDGIEYANHTAPSASKVYLFQWTPPATNIGNIKFYVSAVARDGNISPSPNVYTAVSTLPPTVSDLPSGYRWQTFDVPGALSTHAIGVSNNGLITGTYFTPDNQTRGFLRDVNGGIVTFDGTPQAVNSAGQVVGYYSDGNRTRGFIRSFGGTLAIYDFPGATNTYLYDINDSGKIVGVYSNPPFGGGAFILTNPPDFQIFDGGTPTGITSSGSIIGASDGGLFVRSPEGAVINVRGPSNCGFFARMNDSRMIAGYSTCPQFRSPAPPYPSGFLLAESGRSINYNFGPVFRAINNSGQVVGSSSYASDPGHGLILTPCSASPVSTTISIPGSGGTNSVGITSATEDCRWLAFPESDWITLGSTGEVGTGNGVLGFTVSANPSTTQRTGTFWAAGKSVTVVQQGASCDFTFSGGPSIFQFQGGTGSLTVSGPLGCAWTPTSNVNWIAFGGGASGAGTGSLNFTVAANASTSVRTALITVGTQSFVINQTGAPTPPCSFSLASFTSQLLSSGGSFTIGVNTTAGCAWSVINTAPWISITGSTTGVGNGSVSFTAAPNPLSESRSTGLVVAGIVAPLYQAGNVVPTGGLSFVPVIPCRVADTRPEGGKSGAFGPPLMIQNTTREFPIPSSGCGIPAGARAYSLNVTVVPSGPLGFVTVWPAGEARPNVSTLNAFEGQVVANAAIVPAGSSGGVSVYSSNDTHLIIDINGYFTQPVGPDALVFYSLPPCRLADTRTGSGGPGGAFGPPSLLANSSRDFNVAQGGCNVPSSARAYVLNFTAVPRGPLSFISAWPTGVQRPLVSTLNSFQGRVLANAAIVPASAAGGISVYASDATDVIIDINGFFAPPGGSNALRFYTLSPCRILDTRVTAAILGPRETRAVPMSNGCGVPGSAQAFSLNATVVPPAYLGFLTLWPFGTPQPFVSTLNAWEGQVAANAAIVPGQQGSISVYTSNATHLIVDINGYFAP